MPTTNTNTTPPKYPLRRLGRDGPLVSALGFGTMGIGAWYGAPLPDAEAFAVLDRAADLGVTFWDCADIYGTAEASLGAWFAKTGRREEIFLATKFGAFNLAKGYTTGAPKPAPDSSPAYIRAAVQRSLAQLQTDHIDLYYQHRVDPSVPIEVVLDALRPYVEAGTIRWLGLSECSADTLRRAKAVAGIGAKVVAVQMEYSAFTLDIEKSGFAAVADELGVAVVAYSPLARGMVTGKQRSRDAFEAGDIRLHLPRWSEENFPKNLVVVDKLAAIAARYGRTASQVALAWILAEHPTCKFHLLPVIVSSCLNPT
ncbi:Aldo/keto reductase, partial [Athelia psychrophila]